MPKTNDITLGEAQLGSLVAEVEKELGTMLKAEAEKEAQRLAKARPGESGTDEDSPADSSSASDPDGSNTSAASASPDSASPAPGAGDASSAAGDDGSAGAPPPGAADASASAGPDDGSASADPAADQGQINPDQLVAEYSKLGIEDLKMHYYALKQVLFQMTAAAGDDGSAPAGAAPDASASAGPAAPPPGPADGSAPAIKTEVPAGDKLSSPGPHNGEDPLKVVHKSESEKAVEERLAKTEEAVKGLVAALKVAIETPLRKSVQFTADLKPTAPAAKDPATMSREEIRAALKEKAKDTKLSKADRELITGYDLKTVTVDKIKHLLPKS